MKQPSVSQASYEDRMAGGPLLHVDTPYEGLEGAGGEVYPDEERQHASEVESREQLPRVIQYFVDMYLGFVGDGYSYNLAKSDVQSAMGDYEEGEKIRDEVIQWIDMDILRRESTKRINVALSRSKAFVPPSNK